MGFIALEQALKIEFRASLLQDMVATLVLVQPAQHMDGLGDWLYRVSSRLLADPPPHFYETTTALMFAPAIQGCLLLQLQDDSPVHERFDDLIEFLEIVPAAALSSAIQSSLYDLSVNFELPFPSAPLTELATLKRYLGEVQSKRESMNRSPLPVSIETVAEYLLNPKLVKAGLIESLKALWNAGYAESYEESRHRWQHAIDYHQPQKYETDLQAIFRIVTGRPIPQFIQNAGRKAVRVEWYPSGYVGTYVVYNIYNGTLRISFNANLTPTSSAESDKLVGLYPVLKAMADETRLHILGLLANQEYNVGDLADLLNLSDSTISRHLALLAKTDLVKVRPHGTTRYYRLNPNGLGDVIERLSEI